MEAHQIIDTIRLTEKASLLSELNNSYVFRVHPKAGKLQIKQAIEKVFGKKVVSVNTMNCAGKQRRKKTAAAGKTADWKKAIVKLAPGERFDLA
jgi:large subunit ribosomal protein L23